MRTIIEKDDCFYIEWQLSKDEYHKNKALTNAVIKLPNARFNYKYKRWEVSKNNRVAVIDFAEMYRFDMSKSIRNNLKLEDTPMPKLTVDLNLKLNPYEYQKRGIAYGIQNGSCINGDAPGLGKTAQSIATIVAQDLFPCLVICPASLKMNWEAEWKLWTNHKPIILTDSVKKTFPMFYEMGAFDVFITNYESLKKYFAKNINKTPHSSARLKDVEFYEYISMFKSVIVDESHRVKDPSAMQSKLTAGISKGKTTLLLSGTPIVNKPIDLLSQLIIIDKINDFGGITEFRRMCADSDRWIEINKTLRKRSYFRREKSQVLAELPDKYRQVVPCELTNRKEYDDALTDLRNYLIQYRNATDSEARRSMRGKAMVQIGVLKNISARGKLKDVKDYISDVINGGEKIVVFIYLKEVADILKQEYPNALFYTGSESTHQRNDAIHKFQKCEKCDLRLERHANADHEFEPSSYNLIFVNYKAGGVGITLTAASRIAFIEQPWHSADTDQCEDRCHRISQKNAVQITYFLGKNTIDEKIYKIINNKREMSAECTGAEDNTQEELLNSIIELME